MGRNLRTITHASRPAWRTYKFDDDKRLGQNLTDGNGTTIFGEVLAGTLMSLDGADGIRPMGLQALSSGIAAANEGEMADAANFYVGDVIDLVAAVDSFDAITIDADGAGGTMDVTALEAGASRLRIALTDPGGATQPLVVSVSDDGTNRDIDVSLETDGGSAIVSTVAEVIAALNDTLGWLVYAELNAAVGTETCVAVTQAAMTGGFNVGDVIVDGRNVTDVDKDATPNTVTFDGAVVTVASGTILMLEDLTPGDIAGLLERQVSTADLDNGTLVGVDQQCEVALGGYTDASLVTGYDATLERYLTGAYVAEGVLGPGQAPIFKFVLA
jgi:hypothetical protein